MRLKHREHHLRLFWALGLAELLLMLPQTSHAALSFSDPAPLNSNAGTDSGTDQSPCVATDGAGNWVAVWESRENLGGTIGTDTDILVSRSANNGATWTAPATLNTNATTDTGDDDYPEVTTDGAGNWVAVWCSGEDLGGAIGTDRDILVSRSTSNGAIWTGPAPLNNNAGTDSGNDVAPQVTTDGAGNWVAVWRSEDSLGGTVGMDYDILVSRSTNNGGTWTPPAALNTNAGTDSAGDDNVQVTTDGAGNCVAAWRSDDSFGGTIGTDFDILVSRSTDNGATWTAPAALNTNAGSDLGDDWLPQVTTDGAGNWVAVWSSGENLGGTIGGDWDILVARSTDKGATWTAPAALNTNAGTDSGIDQDPQVTTDGAGNWVAVWFSYDTLGGTIGGDLDILVSRSTNNGATWSTPRPANTNAGTDSGDDESPQVTTDGAGNWVVVWRSDDTLGGTIGTDGDILVAVAHDGGLAADSDGDGLLDSWETRDLDPDTGDVENPFDPNDPDSTGDSFSEVPDGMPDGLNDWDGDGMTNADEFRFGYNPTDPESWGEVSTSTLVGAVALALLVVIVAMRRVSCPRS